MKNIRLKRCAAWVIDWNLSCLPCLLFTILFKDAFRRPSLENMGLILLFLLFLFLIPVTFVLRDVIFKGRSVGKRLFSLYVVNKSTGQPASPLQKILRNLFFFLSNIDVIILLVTKETIGDRIANTTVRSTK